MENLENQDLIPESDTAPTPLPETPPTNNQQSQVESASVEAEAVPATEEPAPVEEAVQETQPPKYEWDYGMTFPSPQKEPPVKLSKPSRSIGKLIIACTIVAAMVLTGSFFTGAVVSSYWKHQNKELQQQLSALQGKTDRLQAQIQNRPSANGGNNTPNNGNSGSSGNTGTGGTMTPSQVYNQNVGAVVTITTNSASGSGFILTDDGYVVTNYHVIENANQVQVSLSDSKSSSYVAKIVGYDVAHDVAVLKIEATDLPHVVLGSSNSLAVGDQITVIGNPLGELSYTQTVGYISGKDRGISTDNTMINMLQTDASINSGNSGGPMFNMNGEVVGIITAKYSGTSASGASIEGIGFAIPIDDVAQKIYALIEFGYIPGAYLGVTVRDMDSSVSQAFGLPMGAYVVTVEKTNCAYAAGVREKDIIIGLGEYTIGSLNELSSALQNFKPGDTTTIKVWRSGSELELTITLDDRPH
ncbi:MAG: trypsin-like peptidase domain-containing protein [Oscillospiraceae bacterium]|nr:trypsin-like peptidase domain-containing protein [Oscillospiraceae bacterium]